MTLTEYAMRHTELAVQMLKGRADANDDMDISSDGFWKSFWAIAFSIPAMLFMWSMGARSDQHPIEGASLTQRLTTEAILDVGLWVLVAAIFTLALPKFGLGARTANFIIARNWTTLFFNYVLAVAFLPGLATGPDNDLIGILVLICFVLIVAGYMRITYQSLQVSFGTAALIVGAEIFASITLTQMIYSASV
ncbi:MAG: hypothetical protein AAGI92_03065 [Pseudomonadota bacterium]